MMMTDEPPHLVILSCGGLVILSCGGHFPESNPLKKAVPREFVEPYAKAKCYPKNNQTYTSTGIYNEIYMAQNYCLGL